MYEWLRDTMVGRLQLPAAGVRPEATPEEAGLDSLAVTELVLIARQELGLELDEDELYGLRTVAEVAEFLRRRTEPVAS
ncbi:acyl carrier protein [Streptomyces hainanensis]|uniref:Acyl carrier protein n=1 Tax=Streptomyces hainanensis TaxID=402648 RepID=A0A4R4SHC6_9ACTN|nr:acyl carrier protein [Streptomyces hainanensis]TDC62907.1 acyl carrier protein [Streptomyces hainanensis]